MARCYGLSRTLSSVLLPGHKAIITPGSPSWGMIQHFIDPLVKYFGWWATNPQKMSPKSGKRVAVACCSQAVPWGRAGFSFVRSRALERMPFSKNRTVRGRAAFYWPYDFGTGRLIKLSAPGYSQLFSWPEDQGMVPSRPMSSAFHQILQVRQELASSASKPCLASRKD